MRRLMQNHAVAYATFHCLLACTVVLSVGSASSAETVAWETEVAAAFEQARAEDRPVLLHFWTPECVPCRQLEHTVFNQPRVIEAMSRNFVAVKVNAHEHPQLATRYGIRSVPKDVIVTADNEELHRMFTPKDPEQYVAQLSAVAFSANRGGLNANVAQADRPFGGDNRPYDRNSELAKADPTRMARRSSLSAETQPTETLITNVDAAVESGPREIINRFARGKTATPNPRETVAADLSADAGQAAQDDSDWGSWPNDRKAYSDRLDASDESLSLDEPLDSRGPVSTPSDTRQWPGDREPAASTSEPESSVDSNKSAEARRANPRASKPSDAPPIALDGYCTVTLLRDNKWVKADKRYGVIHRGRTYLFAGPKEKESFFADPDEFSPILAGIDPVALNEQGKMIEGKRVHGVVYHHRVYLFASEKNLDRFWQDPERFASPIRQALEAGDLNSLFR